MRTAVELTSKTYGAKIYYTLDGSEPDEDAYLYVSPFSLSEDTTVKAKAFFGKIFPSDVVEKRYVFVSAPGQSSVFRSFSSRIISPGEKVSVKLDLIIDDSDLHDSYEINEQIPLGWKIENPGSAEIVSDNFLRWKEFQGGVSTTFNYVLTAPDADDTYDFSGTYFVEGMDYEKMIMGRSQVTVS